jgi:hypothetical protein
MKNPNPNPNPNPFLYVERSESKSTASDFYLGRRSDVVSDSAFSVKSQAP